MMMIMIVIIVMIITITIIIMGRVSYLIQTDGMKNWCSFLHSHTIIFT